MVAQLIPISKKENKNISIKQLGKNVFLAYRHIDTICPGCGKKIKKYVRLWDANPENGKYCNECRQKQRDKRFTNKVSDADFEKFIKHYKKSIDIAVADCLSHHVLPKYLAKEDIKQECLIALFMYLARHGIDYKKGYIYFLKVCKYGIYKAKKNYQYIGVDEEQYLDDKVGGMSELVSYAPTNDITLDMQEMLRKIVELAKKDNNVRLVLEKADCYRGLQDNINYNRLKRKYNVTDSKFDNMIINGMEHIFFNDSDNIQKYVNIHDLTRHNLRFNTAGKTIYGKSWKELPKEKLLEFYSGYRVCSECGKKFVPTNIQRGKAVVQCSAKCKKQASLRRNREYRKAKRGNL